MMNAEKVAELRALCSVGRLIESARNAIDRMARDNTAPRMSLPPRPYVDDDMVIAHALRFAAVAHSELPTLLDEIARQAAEIERLQEDADNSAAADGRVCQDMQPPDDCACAGCMAWQEYEDASNV